MTGSASKKKKKKKKKPLPVTHALRVNLSAKTYVCYKKTYETDLSI